ncbi:hypothetical protein B0T25DRAFT_584102 [Lasiosphaeria hispida]|uniref:FAD-binding PCMH-type domain-containing protein n=1 Tax=Lasiosphaeria hispida TaxID=260671 RepID=A0AAJ0HCE8_9PEZI|nr:hypothetical protein B0T25DRAFT_584102 [Lasiosphaeria hispida]
MHAGALIEALVGFALVGAAQAGLFPSELIQLTESDIGNFSALAFSDPSRVLAGSSAPQCRAWPGSGDWPSDGEWRQLNTSLGGALLRPVPVASACYKGENYDAARCRYLVQQAGRTHFWIEDPLVVLTQWPQGSTCVAALNAQGNCTRGGFPEYVVNATTVKHVQAAVNFARNKNIRLVIKNTGHDFGGRSTGAGSLSIWVHKLKEFEFIANYTTNGYSGMAVRVGAGIESFELFNYMAQHKITVVSPGGSTVGVVGGWLAAGGHGSLTSKFGLGSDQVLSINVVTAGGKFLTVGPESSGGVEEELWWALRGGGPSTFGVMTSVVLRAFPPISVLSVPVGFSVNPTGATNQAAPFPGFPDFNFTMPANSTFPNFTFPFPTNESDAFPFPNITFPFPTNGSFPGFNGTFPGIPFGGPSAGSSLTNVATFWKGVRLVYRYCSKVLDAGGYCYSFIYPLGNSSFTFSNSAFLPDISSADATALMAPLFGSLGAAGINISAPRLPERAAAPYAAGRRNGGGDSPVNTRYHSRLLPRRNWDDDALYEATWDAIQHGIEEGGYTFHGIAYAPTAKVAGPIGADSAVNPAWRSAALHASYMETQPAGAITALDQRERDAKAKRYLDQWRAVTPGAGAYINEGDPAEPDWQNSFYGEANYGRLLGIKKKTDPWGVFWAQTTVGSEGWEVKTWDGYPFSQNGRLCRV